MLILCTEVLKYVDLWNHYRIQKQHDSIVLGRPYVLYYYPQESNGEQCGFYVLLELLAEMQKDIQPFGKGLAAASLLASLTA